MIYLNCLAKDLKNAKAILEASNGKALIGVLTKDFTSDQEAITTMQKWSENLDQKISIGLGNGDPHQSAMVARVAKKVNAYHINQVFTGVGATRSNTLNHKAIINALVKPCKEIGKVKISTGPESSKLKPGAIIDVESAAIIIKEMGGSAIKYMSMKELENDQEFIAVAKACAKYDLILEPTGGLNLENLEKYIKYAKEAGVKKIIPHLYSSIIDSQTGETKIEDVKKVWTILDKYY